MPNSFHTLVVMIKPTLKPNEEKVDLTLARTYAPAHAKEVVLLFVDNNITRLHECDTNTETINSVLRFLKYSQGTSVDHSLVPVFDARAQPVVGDRDSIMERYTSTLPPTNLRPSPPPRKRISKSTQL